MSQRSAPQKDGATDVVRRHFRRGVEKVFVPVPLTSAQSSTCTTECTKIAHRRSLAIFTADEGITGSSAARTICTHFLRRRNRGSLAIFFAEKIAHLGAPKIARFFGERKKSPPEPQRITRFWCTQMHCDLLFHCVFGNHRHNGCDGNAMLVHIC